MIASGNNIIPKKPHAIRPKIKMTGALNSALVLHFGHFTVNPTRSVELSLLNLLAQLGQKYVSNTPLKLP